MNDYKFFLKIESSTVNSCNEYIHTSIQGVMLFSVV